MKEDNKTVNTKKEFDLFDRPGFIRWFLRVFYFICALLVVADFVIHRHVYTDIEKVPTFYAVYGLVSCVALVVLAKVIRKIVIRDEDYYGDNPDERGNLDD